MYQSMKPTVMAMETIIMTLIKLIIQISINEAFCNGKGSDSNDSDKGKNPPSPRHQ